LDLKEEQYTRTDTRTDAVQIKQQHSGSTHQLHQKTNIRQ